VREMMENEKDRGLGFKERDSTGTAISVIVRYVPKCNRSRLSNKAQVDPTLIGECVTMMGAVFAKQA